MIIGGEIASSMILVNHDCIVQSGAITIAFLHSSWIFCSTFQIMLTCWEKKINILFQFTVKASIMDDSGSGSQDAYIRIFSLDANISFSSLPN